MPLFLAHITISDLGLVAALFVLGAFIGARLVQRWLPDGRRDRK